MASPAKDWGNSIGDDAGAVGEAWRQFVRDDAALTSPSELEGRVLAAWDMLQYPERRSHPPGRIRLFWAAGAVASALAAAFVMRADLTTPVPGTSDSRADVPAIRNAGEAPPSSRPMLKLDAVLTLTAEPPLETETLQLVRVRMPRLALQAVGVVVSGPNADGLVEVDVVVGDDGLPRNVRRVALVR